TKALGPLGQALGRIAGAGVGGEVGSTLEGRTPGAGFLQGAGPTATIETAGAGIGQNIRSLPGMKGRINASGAEATGGVLGQISPPLAGAKTVEDFRRFAQGEGRGLLGAAKERANEEIAQGIGAREGNLELPSLGRTVTEPSPAAV